MTLPTNISRRQALESSLPTASGGGSELNDFKRCNNYVQFQY